MKSETQQDEFRNQLIIALKSDSQLIPDGHGYYLPEYYYHMGFPIEFVDLHVRKHESDGTYKGTIYKDNFTKTRHYVVGVDNLEMLESIAELFNLKIPFFYGRGRKALALVRAINSYITITPDPSLSNCQINVKNRENTSDDQSDIPHHRSCN